MSNGFYSLDWCKKKSEASKPLPHWSVLLEHLKYTTAVLTEFSEQKCKLQKENMASIMGNLMWKSIPPVFLKFHSVQIVYSILRGGQVRRIGSSFQELKCGPFLRLFQKMESFYICDIFLVAPWFIFCFCFYFLFSSQDVFID